MKHAYWLSLTRCDLEATGGENQNGKKREIASLDPRAACRSSATQRSCRCRELGSKGKISPSCINLYLLKFPFTPSRLTSMMTTFLISCQVYISVFCKLPQADLLLAERQDAFVTGSKRQADEGFTLLHRVEIPAFFIFLFYSCFTFYVHRRKRLQGCKQTTVRTQAQPVPRRNIQLKT